MHETCNGVFFKLTDQGLLVTFSDKVCSAYVAQMWVSSLNDSRWMTVNRQERSHTLPTHSQSHTLTMPFIPITTPTHSVTCALTHFLQQKNTNSPTDNQDSSLTVFQEKIRAHLYTHTENVKVMAYDDHAWTPCRCICSQTHTIFQKETIRSRVNISTGLHCFAPLFRKATFSALHVRKGGR